MPLRGNWRPHIHCTTGRHAPREARHGNLSQLLTVLVSGLTDKPVVDPGTGKAQVDLACRRMPGGTQVSPYLHPPVIASVFCDAPSWRALELTCEQPNVGADSAKSKGI